MTLDAERALYDRVAVETAAVVIRRYSTSFGMATALLGKNIRPHVKNLYALVRVADEVVDGVAASAGLDQPAVLAALDALEAETVHALGTGYSANLVVHAFALSAREHGIGTDLTEPFFASMRADCLRSEHSAESFERYVFGSAEVVGLMCLRVFLSESPADTAERERLTAGARRLGAAFQKVNFLRDIAADEEGLGRAYFPGVDIDHLTEDTKAHLVADIREDLAASAAVLPGLPRSSRRAVALAQALFTELTDRIEATPAARLSHTRVRVPDPVKARLAAGVLLGRLPR